MPTPDRPLRAALWMIGSILAFSAMAIAGRQIGTAHDSFEIMTVRSAVGFCLIVIVGLATGRLREVTAQHFRGHILRNVVHFTGQNLWFWALTMIPLAQLFAIEFTSPIWVILLSPLLLGERLTRARLIAAGLGFAGILIVARPDLSAPNMGVLAAAGAALGFAATSILTKKLTRGESIISILFWLTLMQFFFGLIGAGYDGVFAMPTTQTLPWLMVIGFPPVLMKPTVATTFSLLISSWAICTPRSFLASSSRSTSSILRPITPPAALISSTASFTPSRMLTPIDDEPPVNGPDRPILIGSAALTAPEVASAMPARSAT